MKKLNYIVRLVSLTLLITTLNGCSKDFLDLNPTTTLNSGNAYKSAKDLNNAITGAYNAFYQEYYEWDYILLGDERSDNAYAGGGGDINTTPYDNLTIMPGNTRMEFDWAQLYLGIGRCNVILDKVNEVKDPAMDENNTRQNIIGQASFLRAYHYYHLVKTWGGVPIELHSNTTDPTKTNIPRSTEKEVYDQIVKDLQVAIDNLPDSYSDDNTENKVRATKGAANALMAKVWAQRSDRDYSKVITYCDAVINSPAGYALMPNYADLFDGDHYMNSESILEIAFKTDPNWITSNWGTALFNEVGDGFQSYCVPSKDLVHLYNSQNDSIRMNANIIFRTANVYADENWNPCNDPNVKVPYNYKEKHPNGWNGGDHLYLLRLADILLLKAEALNETNNLAGALTVVNEIVRKRVGLPAISAANKVEMRAKILDERRMELAFEGQRFDDLVRNGVFVSTMNNLKEYKFTCNDGTPSDPILINYNATVEKQLCPIPQNERDRNPKIDQNPGY
jgi:hypothetical protein